MQQRRQPRYANAPAVEADSVVTQHSSESVCLLAQSIYLTKASKAAYATTRALYTVNTQIRALKINL